MSAAVTEITPRRQRRTRRVKEIANRIVMNLPTDYAWRLRNDARDAGLPTAAFARMLVVEAYRARGITPKKVKAEFAAYSAQQAQAEADAELAEES